MNKEKRLASGITAFLILALSIGVIFYSGQVPLAEIGFVVIVWSSIAGIFFLGSIAWLTVSLISRLSSPNRLSRSARRETALESRLEELAGLRGWDYRGVLPYSFVGKIQSATIAREVTSLRGGRSFTFHAELETFTVFEMTSPRGDSWIVSMIEFHDLPSKVMEFPTHAGRPEIWVRNGNCLVRSFAGTIEKVDVESVFIEACGVAERIHDAS